MNIFKTAAAAACGALILTACAPVTTGGRLVSLTPERAQASHIASITFSSGWAQVEEDFSEDVTEEVLAELAACARGPAPLHLRLHVREAHREGRLQTVLNGGGEHTIAGLAEFVDPKTKAVVGRYPFDLAVDAGGPVKAILADRQLLMGQAVGRNLCRKAFGAG